MRLESTAFKWWRHGNRILLLAENAFPNTHFTGKFALLWYISLYAVLYLPIDRYWVLPTAQWSADDYNFDGGRTTQNTNIHVL